jgi:hypothetical protein
MVPARQYKEHIGSLSVVISCASRDLGSCLTVVILYSCRFSPALSV